MVETGTNLAIWAHIRQQPRSPYVTGLQSCTGLRDILTPQQVDSPSATRASRESILPSRLRQYQKVKALVELSHADRCGSAIANR